MVPYSVGGDSTINRIKEFLVDLKTTGRTHNRIMVIEVFGRYAGHTAFRGGVAGEADAILIPEVPVDFDELYRHMKKVFMKRIQESDVKAGTYTIWLPKDSRMPRDARCTMIPPGWIRLVTKNSPEPANG